jgi:Nickel responsive protein SCO4226-like
MSLVMVERTFPEPVELPDIQAIEDRGASCLEAHGVRFLKTYFSRDRRRMMCLYEAPDAESVRLAQTKAGVPFDKAWTGRLVRHPGPDVDGEAIVVERTLPEPMDEPALRQAVSRSAWCLEQWGCRLVSSFLSNDGWRLVCVFAAADAESVRQSQKQAKLPFDVAWPGTMHEPAPPAS